MNQKTHIVSDCEYEVVFCVKFRRSVLTEEMIKRLRELLCEACEEEVKINRLTIQPCYVRLQLSVTPQYGIHKAVKQLKAYTSKIMREEFPALKSKLPTLWTHNYYVCTLGQADDETIEKYIIDQKNK